MKSKPIENLLPLKLILTYVSIIGLGYILFPAVWGLVNGVAVAPRIISEPDFQNELKKILTNEEVKNLDLARMHALPPSKKSAIETLVRIRLNNINWLPVHFVVNGITFAVLGLILGFFRIQKYAIFIPLFLLPSTLTVLGAQQFLFHSTWLTIIVGLATQVVAVYGCSVAGGLLRTKLFVKTDGKLQKKSI